MKQFGKILKFELKDFVKDKVFVGITIFLVVAIALVMFFPRIKTAFLSNNTGNTPADKAVMLLKADKNTPTDLIYSTFAQAFTDYDVQLTDKGIDSIKQAILDDNVECAFILSGPGSYTYYVNNLTMTDTNQAIAVEVLQQTYQMQTLLEYGMTPEEAAAVMAFPIDGQTEALGKDQIQNFFYTYIMIFALYLVIMLYGQVVAMSVATEKSSRAMELLITSAKPVNMMFGKVLAACIAGLTQLIAVFGSALLFYGINKPYWGNNEIINSIFAIPPDLLGYMLAFFLLGFLIYAFLYGAISSTVSKLEDINTAVQPITFLFVIGFLVTMLSMSSGNVDSTLMRVCSYIPFTSPMAMFTRIAMGTVAWYEIAASIAILIGSTVGIGLLSAKIYRVGVLLYGTPPKLPAIIKAVWKA